MARLPATIRHRASPRRRSQVVVTVTPNDGRFAEEFVLPERELVRFAWAVLADYEPDEAAAAGGAPAAPVLPMQTRRRGARPGRGAPLAPGGVMHVLLSEINAAGTLLLRDLCAAPRQGLTKDQVRKQVEKLIDRRLVARVEVQEGDDYSPPALACTHGGRTTLSLLDAAEESQVIKATAA